MYSIFQKFISAILLSISISLAALSFWSHLNMLLSSQPPFTVNGKSDVDTEYSFPASSLGVTKKASSEPKSLHAAASCLIDADSGRILFGKAENKKLPMASTTKIMTCILALEHGNPEDIVTFSDYAASMPDVQLNARAGETFLLKDLLYSLMLESHNDTAVAIAEHIGGSVEQFADLMNEKAVELGLTSTHFVTPNGLDDPEHYTTAKELCLLAAYALENSEFCEIIQTPDHSFQSQNKHRSFTANNHDSFLNSYKGAIGVKTGFTGDAGYCFCGAAKRGDTILVSSVLACGWPPHKTYKWADTTALMNYGFDSFSSVSMPDSPALPTIHAAAGTQSKLHLKRSSQRELNTILMTAEDSLRICYELPDTVYAPIRAGDIIGYEHYYLNDTLLYRIPLVASHEIKEADSKYLTRLLTKLYFCTAISG